MDLYEKNINLKCSSWDLNIIDIVINLTIDIVACYTLKLVSNIFYQIFVFPPNVALQKLRKMFFISSKKLFSFSRYSNFCIFFPSFPLSRFKRKNGSGIIYDVMNCFAYICRCNFWNPS